MIMNKFLYKNIQMQYVITSCCLLGTAFSASLFGLDFSGPKKVVKTGIEGISQVLKPNIQQHTNSPLGFNHQSSDRNTNEKENLTPSGIGENFKDKTKEPSKINDLTQHYNQISDSGIPIQKNSEKEPGLLNSNKDQNTSISKLVTENLTAFYSETGTDYTTETSEYETTTTCESVNRIGGVPPNVVASLLG